MKIRRYMTEPPPGHLWVECWCRRSVVAVPVELIGKETRACERCKERAA